MDSYFSNAAGGYFSRGPSKKSTESLSPEARETLLGDIAAKTGTAAEHLLNLIDIPAAGLRNALVGAPGSADTTPEEVLDQYNLLPDKDLLGGWARPAASFMAGAVLDPLNMVSFGGKSVAGAALRAVRNAKNVNLLDDAARIASREAIEKGALDTRHAQTAIKSFQENFGKGLNDLTDADLQARPLVGPRQAQRDLTMQKILDAQDEAERLSLRQQLQNALPKGTAFDDVANAPLRYDIGLGMPFSDNALIGMDLPGGKIVSAGLDRFGQAVRWSAPMRQAHAAFNKEVLGGVDEADQIIGKQITAARNSADPAAMEKIQGALSRLGGDAFSSEAISKSMRNVLTGHGTDDDLALMASRPDLQGFVDEWKRGGGTAETLRETRKNLGLPSAEWASNYGSEYFPRHANDLSFLSRIAELETQGIRRGAMKGGRAVSAVTPDMLARKEYLDLPGGEAFINELSVDPVIAGANDLSDNAAALYLKKRIDAKTDELFPGGVLPSGEAVKEYSLQNAKKLGKMLRKLDPDSVKEKLPLFGAHFADDYSRSIRGNAEAAKVAESLYDILASSAKVGAAGKIKGGGHVPLVEAAGRLGLRTTVDEAGVMQGAKMQLLERLQKHGLKGVEELANFSIDERMLERLTRMADFYDYPTVQKGWIKAFDDYTRVWKGSILAWPARFVRDWYSGAFSNAVEAGVGTGLWNGYVGAKHLIQGDMVRLGEIVSQIPAYRQLAAKFGNEAAIERFRADVAMAGVMGGRRSADLMDSRRALQTGEDIANEFLPGKNPRTTAGYQAYDILTGHAPLDSKHAAYSELGGNWDRFMDMGLKRPQDVGNPILRWGQRQGDVTDSINRTAGYIALLFNGISPLEAAARIKAAHVDYSSLTKLERDGIRRFIPFWSFTSRIGKWLAEKMWESPGGRLTQFGLRAPQALLESGEGEYVPESMQARYGMQVDPSFAQPFGGVPEGVTPWLAGISLPTDQLNMVKMAMTPSGWIDAPRTLFKTGLDVVGRMGHPVPKAILERMSGQNLYTKRPLKDFTPVASELLASLPYGFDIPVHSTAGQAIKEVAPAIDWIPFASRPMQMLNRLIDSEEVPNLADRVYQAVVNSQTGAQLQNIPEDQERSDLRRRIREMLAEEPLVKSLTISNIPKDKQHLASEELLGMMALERELGREAKAARERTLGLPVPARPRSRTTESWSYFD